MESLPAQNETDFIMPKHTTISKLYFFHIEKFIKITHLFKSLHIGDILLEKQLRFAISYVQGVTELAEEVHSVSMMQENNTSHLHSQNILC